MKQLCNNFFTYFRQANPPAEAEQEEAESEFQRSSREHREYLDKCGAAPVTESVILAKRSGYIEELTNQQYEKEKKATALQHSKIECVGPKKENLILANIEVAKIQSDFQKCEDLERSKQLVVTKKMSLKLKGSTRDVDPNTEKVHLGNMRDLAKISQQRRELRESIKQEKWRKFIESQTNQSKNNLLLLVILSCHAINFNNIYY